MSARRMARGKSYQRLEFLGDRVLGLADRRAAVRDLSRRAGGRVVPTSCGTRAPRKLRRGRIGLGRRTASASSAPARRRRASGATRRSWPTSAKSIIGAVFLDGGYGEAKALIERAFSGNAERPAARCAIPRAPCRNGRKGEACRRRPIGMVEQTGPDHAPRFRVMVKVKGAESEFGLGASKRIAEQAAARSLLLREGVWTEDDHGIA